MIYQSKVKNFNYKNWIIIWFCFKNTNIFKRLEKLTKKNLLNVAIWILTFGKKLKAIEAQKK